LGLKTAVESALLAQVQDELANEDLTTEELSAALAVLLSINPTTQILNLFFWGGGVKKHRKNFFGSLLTLW